MTALTSKILKAATTEEAKKLYESVKGSVLQSKLKRKLIESTHPDAIDTKLSFLRSQPKSPTYKLPDSSKYLGPRMAKWQTIAENLAKMDEVILKEYRERRREGKDKEKKNKNPF